MRTPALPETGSQASCDLRLETLSASWATWALSMTGTSEDNSAVQVISTPAALVSYFQVLFLDFLEVLQ